MGLIDADDMIKSLMDMTYYDDEGHTIHDYEDRLAIVKGFVDSVPTVDAVPVRHGKWIPWKYHNGFRCEFCNEPVDNKHNYCPNCGAKMDGAERKEE